MLQNYVRQLLVFAFILVSFTALGQSFGTSVNARYGDGCRLDFYNVSNVKIFSLRGSELRYWYNPSNQIIVRDENTQVTDLYGISGLASLIDSVQSVCLAGLCSTPTPPTEFSFCGSPVFDFFENNIGFGNNDTIAGTGSSNIVSFQDSIYLHLYNTGIAYEDYNYGGCLGGIACDSEIDSCATEFNLECSKIESLSITVDGETETYIEYFLCGEVATVNPQGWLYTFVGTQFDTLDLNTFAITASSDTVIKNDIIIPIQGGNFETLRILGVNFTNITKDDNTIYITSYPVKTSGQTYASNSFKIQKLAYADIDAPVLSQEVYNPNSGEQTKSLAITTGQNTYCIQVEDTNGNVAYTIFQLTKTAL